MRVKGVANTRELLGLDLCSIRFNHPEHKWKDNRYNPQATRRSDNQSWTVSQHGIDIVVPDQDVEYVQESYRIDAAVDITRRASTVTLTHFEVKVIGAKDVHITLSERVYHDNIGKAYPYRTQPAFEAAIKKKTCDGCKHYTEDYEGARFGRCDGANRGAGENDIWFGGYSNEGGVDRAESVQVGAKFGCLLWEQKP